MNTLADHLYEAALAQLTDQQDKDRLEFARMMERYGPDRILTWWRNTTQIMYGPHSPSTPGDPRR